MQKTLAIIKPDAVDREKIGPILTLITEAGFRISRMNLTNWGLTESEKFYQVHNGQPFFSALTNFMSSGPIVVIELEKENAIEDWRKLMGPTSYDVNQTDDYKNTIRGLFATSTMYNCVHGSDSIENAEIELSFAFQN